MFPHITSDPEILGGKPCIKGTRISVEFVLELFASGATHKDLLDAYPHRRRRFAVPGTLVLQASASIVSWRSPAAKTFIRRALRGMG